MSSALTKAPPRGQGHTALRTSSEDALPLTDINGHAGDLGTPRVDVYTNSPGTSNPASPNPSMPSSPNIGFDTTSPKKAGGALHAPIPTIAVENPFEPPGSATPLREYDGVARGGAETELDEQLGASAVMSPSSPPPQEHSPFDDPPLTARPTSDRPTLQATSSFSGKGSHPLAQPPPPMPLDIPPPKTPPPRTPSTLPVSTPPKPKSEPSLRQRQGSGDGEGEEEKRWWTDWLCGCRESGRDNQVRFIPFSLFFYPSTF